MKWKCIPGYEQYEVSDMGYVRRNGRILKPRPLPKGHLQVSLCKDGKARNFLVHHLVLKVFVGPRPKGMEACHFPDRNPANNQLDNLRWDTRSSNRMDSKIHGTWPQGSKHKNAKLTEQDVLAIRASEKTHQMLADMFQVSRPIITRIKNNQRWSHV